MSDPDFITITINGQRGRVPRANAQALMKQLDDDGVPFDAEMGPAPEGPEQPAQASGPAAAPPKPLSTQDMTMELGKRAWNSSMEGLTDLQRGAAQGMTWRAGDEISAMGDPQRLEQFRHDNAVSQERSPWLYGAGEVMGGIAPGLVAGPASLAARGIMSRIGAGAGEGAIQGAVTGAAGANTDDLTSQAIAALAGGTMGGLGGAAVPAMGAMSKAAAPYVREMGDLAASRTVERGPAYRNITKKHGHEFAERELGQWVEQNTPEHAIPQSSRWFAEQLTPVAEAAGPRVGQMVDQATSEVPQAMLTDDLLAQMRGAQGRSAGTMNLPAQRDAVTSAALIDLVEGKLGGQKYLSPSDLHRLKVDMQDVGWPNDATKADVTGREQLMHQEMSRFPRRALDSAIDELALPETARGYQDAKRNYAMADTAAAAAQDKADADGARRMAGGLGGTLRSIGMGAMFDREPDATRMAMRAGEGALGAVDRFAGRTEQRPTNSLMGFMGGRAAGDYQASKSQREQEAIRTMEQARGQHFTRAITQALETNPASLGPYAQELQEARASGDPMRFQATISQLNQDPQFRMSVGQRLLQQTGGMR